MWGGTLSGSDEDSVEMVEYTDDDVADIIADIAACTDSTGPYEDDCVDVGEFVSQSEDSEDEDATAYGYYVIYVWQGANDDVNVMGYTNNAVAMAASFTAAAVAGLFF